MTEDKFYKKLNVIMGEDNEFEDGDVDIIEQVYQLTLERLAYDLKKKKGFLINKLHGWEGGPL